MIEIWCLVYWLLNKFLCNDLWDTNLKVKDFRPITFTRAKRLRNWKKAIENLLSKVGLEYRSLGYKKISKTQYLEELSNISNTPVTSNTTRNETFKAVVDYRKFEIDMYWKRATYFWAFIASAFVAYAAVLTSNYSEKLPMLIVICVGFILSNAWHYSNKGSKTWQRHWEKHLDLLEDPHTGPLYKTIFSPRTYSVSKINDIVSNAFRIAWLALGMDFFERTDRLYFDLSIKSIDPLMLPVICITFLLWTSMKFGKGRGRFRKRDVKIYRRL